MPALCQVPEWDLEASVSQDRSAVLEVVQPWFSGLDRQLVSPSVAEAELATALCKRSRKVSYELPPYFHFGPE